MKAVVVYTSKHGTTYSIAKHISLAINADVFSLDEFDADSLVGYDTIILGTPIYAGKAYGGIDVFCRDNFEILLTKKLALFASGLTTSVSKQQRLLHSVFLKPLLAHASAATFVGGAINNAKLSSTEKLITRTVLKIDADVTSINQPAIEQLLSTIN